MKILIWSDFGEPAEKFDSGWFRWDQSHFTYKQLQHGGLDMPLQVTVRVKAIDGVNEGK